MLQIPSLEVTAKGRDHRPIGGVVVDVVTAGETLLAIHPQAQGRGEHLGHRIMLDPHDSLAPRYVIRHGRSDETVNPNRYGVRLESVFYPAPSRQLVGRILSAVDCLSYR